MIPTLGKPARPDSDHRKLRTHPRRRVNSAMVWPFAALCLLSLLTFCGTSCASRRGGSSWYRGPSEHKALTREVLQAAPGEMRRLDPTHPVREFDFKRHRVTVQVVPRADMPAQFPRGWSDQPGPRDFRIVIPDHLVHDRRGWMHEAGHIIGYLSGHPTGNDHHRLWPRYMMSVYR